MGSIGGWISGPGGSVEGWVWDPRAGGDWILGSFGAVDLVGWAPGARQFWGCRPWGLTPAVPPPPRAVSPRARCRNFSVDAQIAAGSARCPPRGRPRSPWQRQRQPPAAHPHPPTSPHPTGDVSPPCGGKDPGVPQPGPGGLRGGLVCVSPPIKPPPTLIKPAPPPSKPLVLGASRCHWGRFFCPPRPLLGVLLGGGWSL